MPKISHGISIKTPPEIKLMAEGGKKLAEIKNHLKESIAEGVSAYEIDKKANELITNGGKSSFKMVPGYSWATCVNINAGLVHGVPAKEIIFKKGDLVSVDVGMYYKGFHTDTSFSMAINPSREVKNFLKIGETALRKAIDQARPGNRIYDISRAIEKHIEANGAIPIRALVGHGVGKSLHEGPQIPCFVKGSRDKSEPIVEGMVLAIEVMYCQGNPEVIVAEDGWTISMRDGKISGLFEETVAVTKHGPLVLTGL